MQQALVPVDTGSHRRLEQLGAAVFVLYALAQSAQELILARLPSGTDAATRYQVALSPPDRFRAIFLYVCFLCLPFAYVAVYRRLRSGWALAGLVWMALFLALELVNRALELGPMAEWQRAWLAAPPGGVRELLGGRLDLLEAVELGDYLPLLVAHALGSLAFAVALSGPDRWTRLARIGFGLDCVRAMTRVGAMFFGVSALAPVAAAIYLPLTLAQVLSAALWLSVPARLPAGRVGGQ